MFDIGWSELVVIGVVALIAIGPKELPGVLRMVGQWIGKARRMASEFQGQFNEAMREAEMADIKKTFDEASDAAKGLSPVNLLTSIEKYGEDALKTDPPVVPTTPEPPTPATFVEAEAHAPAPQIPEPAPETPVQIPEAQVPDAKAS
ncbi:Sec-independent protein translocase protein TatB [soil metagenome]